MSVGEVDIGVCVWFRAPIRHRMFGRNLARQWHVVCKHVHLRSQSRIVCLGGLLLRLLALVTVNNQVFYFELPCLCHVCCFVGYIVQNCHGVFFSFGITRGY